MTKTTQETINDSLQPLPKNVLLKYTGISVVIALLALVTIILPAEYNIDPTGIGHQLGLTVFNSEKANSENLSAEKASSEKLSSEKASAEETPSKVNPTKENQLTVIKKTETIAVIVPPERGVEYKFTLLQYQKMTYEWKTDGAVLYFDLHGEPEGDTTGYFESYAIATLSEMEGSFTAPFTGVHGWYWKNTSSKPVTVQLIVAGDYSEHGLK